MAAFFFALQVEMSNSKILFLWFFRVSSWFQFYNVGNWNHQFTRNHTKQKVPRLGFHDFSFRVFSCEFVVAVLNVENWNHQFTRNKKFRGWTFTIFFRVCFEFPGWVSWRSGFTKHAGLGARPAPILFLRALRPM